MDSTSPPNKYMIHDPSLNSTMVVQCKPGETLEDCIQTMDVPGAKTVLFGKRQTDCIIDKGNIYNAGRIVLDGCGETLLRMKAGAVIHVDVNARLLVEGQLVMEEDTRLFLQAGTSLEVRGTLHLASAAALTIKGRHCENFLYRRLRATLETDHHVPSEWIVPRETMAPVPAMSDSPDMDGCSLFRPSPAIK